MAKILPFLMFILVMTVCCLEPATAAVTKRSEVAVRAKPAPKPVPPLESSAGLPKVLSPARFSGNAKLGYAAAAQVPQTCSKVFCYCGCDVTDGHKTLLDCFTNPHGADCHMCQEEALTALRLRKEKQPIGEVQRQIDLVYSGNYPFSKPSELLKQYLDSRQYTSK